MAFPSDTLTNTFKVELLEGGHDFQVAGNTFNIALYDDSTTMTAATATYPGAGVNGELAATGNYTQGGQALTAETGFPQWDTDTAIVDFVDEVFSNATFSAMGALIYNTTTADATVCLLDFVSLQTATAGDFTIQFQAPAAATAIIRIA